MQSLSLIFLSLLLSVVFFIFFVKIVIIKRLVFYLLLSFLFGFICMILLICNIFNSNFFDLFFYSTVTYLFLSFCIFNFINSAITSLRVRILFEFLTVFPEGLTIEDLHSKYSNKIIFDIRVFRLLSSNQILLTNSKLITRRGIVYYIDLLFKYLTLLILGKKNEL